MRPILLTFWKADQKGSSKIGTLSLMLMLVKKGILLSGNDINEVCV